MKLKAVIKVPSINDETSRRKAMEIAVIPGVTSVECDDKNQIIVTGEGIDLTYLTVKIRKKIGFTEIVSVAPIPENNPEEKKPDEKKPDGQPPDGQPPDGQPPTVQPILYHPYQYGAPTPYWSEMRHPMNPDPCTIM